MMTSPLQLAADSLLQSAMANDSATFDAISIEIIDRITGPGKQPRPAMRGWMLGERRKPDGTKEGITSYRTNRFGLQCVDICAKRWAIVDDRVDKPKFYMLPGN